MQHLHNDIQTLRRFMRDLYREFPAMRGKLQAIAVTPAGPVFVHPDKRAARAFAKSAQRRFQDPSLRSMWDATLHDCHRWQTSMYSPHFDALFVSVGAEGLNGGFDLDIVLRHELGHALDDLDFKNPRRRVQLHEMTADAFAVLHHLRQNPQDRDAVHRMADTRSKFCGRRRHHPFNTLPAIDAAITFADAHDLTTMSLPDLAATARRLSEKVCPEIIYVRDARGRFLKNPFV